MNSPTENSRLHTARAFQSQGTARVSTEERRESPAAMPAAKWQKYPATAYEPHSTIFRRGMTA